MDSKLQLQTPAVPCQQDVNLLAVLPYAVKPAANVEIMGVLEQLYRPLIEMTARLSVIQSMLPEESPLAGGVKSVMQVISHLSNAYRTSDVRSCFEKVPLKGMSMVLQQFAQIVARNSDIPELDATQRQGLVNGLRLISTLFNDFWHHSDQNEPSKLTISIDLNGMKSDTSEFSQRLRRRALELIRESQLEAASDNNWSVVRDEEGKVVRFRAPLGSEAPPVLPPLDIDNPETALQILSNISEAVETSRSGLAGVKIQMISADELSDQF